MKKKKFSLDDLEVKSFVTNSEQLKGGACTEHTNASGCECDWSDNCATGEECASVCCG